MGKKQSRSVSVFSDESWWGEHEVAQRPFGERPLFQYSLTNLGGVNSVRDGKTHTCPKFQYSLTNLGGVNLEAGSQKAVRLKVSVFSDESWWGEQNKMSVTNEKYNVSVFSDESWWGELRFVDGFCVIVFCFSIL